jgi:predicted NBD/HSP70 family sugar kinase
MAMNPYVASHLKDLNRKTVYALIAKQGSVSKAEISRLTGISPPTTIKIVNHLINASLVLETGEGESCIGRKPQMLTLNHHLMYAAVFFFEGEFLSYGMVNIRGEAVYKKNLRCIPRFEDIMTRISNGLIDGMFAEADIPLDKLMGIGIALPAIYNPEEHLILTAPLIGVTQPTDISGKITTLVKKYGVTVLVENDANAQCLGEFYAAGTKGGKDLVFISLGTGIGAGVILDGKLRRGSNYMGGEIGYFSFMDDYPLGANSPGWLENKIGRRSLEEQFAVGIDTDVTKLAPQTLQSLLDYVSAPMALCINNIVMLLDCSRVRIGGVMGNMLGDPLVDAINERLGRLCINRITVERQMNGDSGLIGMAAPLMEDKVVELLTGDGTGAFPETGENPAISRGR